MLVFKSDCNVLAYDQVVKPQSTKLQNKITSLNLI